MTYPLDLVYIQMLWGAPALALGFIGCSFFTKGHIHKTLAVVMPLLLGLSQIMIWHMATMVEIPDSDIAELIGVQGKILFLIAIVTFVIHGFCWLWRWQPRDTRTIRP